MSGLGAAGCVRLAVLGLSLGAGHEFDARQRQKIAQLGRIKEVGRVQRSLDERLPIAHRDGSHPVALHLCGNRFVLEQHQKPAAGSVRRKQMPSMPQVQLSARGKARKQPRFPG